MVMALRSIPNGDRVHILGFNNTYSIGRNRRNHIQLKDSSISAQHASLQTKNGIAYIQDVDSKHGTWVNDVSASLCVKLKHKDIITFGGNSCRYVFIQITMNIHIEQSSYSLLTALRSLKFIHTQDYSECNNYYVTSFVSQETMRSTSILHYLIARKYVVTPKYFTDLCRDIKEAPALPNIYRYMPEIDFPLQRQGVVDINPRAKRNTLFDNVLFIFFDEQDHELIRVFIEKCSGEALLYIEDPYFKNVLLKEEKSCHYVIVDTQERSKIVNNFVLFLKAAERDVQKMSSDDICLSILKAEFNRSCLTVKSKKLSSVASNDKTLEKHSNNLSNVRLDNTKRNLTRKQLKENSNPENNAGPSRATSVALQENSRSMLPKWLLKTHSSSKVTRSEQLESTKEVRKAGTQKELTKKQDSLNLLHSQLTERTSSFHVEDWVSDVESSSSGLRSNSPELTNSTHKSCTQKEIPKKPYFPSFLPSELTKRTTRSCTKNCLSEVQSSSSEPCSSSPGVTNSAHKRCTQKEIPSKQYFSNLLPRESTGRLSRSSIENWLSEVESVSNRSDSNPPEMANLAHKSCTQKEIPTKQDFSNVLPPESTGRVSRSCIENWLSEVESVSNGSGSNSQEATNSAHKSYTQKDIPTKQDFSNVLPPESTGRVSRSCIENWLSEVESASTGTRSNSLEVTNSAYKSCTSKEVLKEQVSPSLLSSESSDRTRSFGIENWLLEVMSSSNEQRQELIGSVYKSCTQIEFSKKRDLPTQLPPESTSRSCVENWVSEAPKSSNEPRQELTNSVHKTCTQIEFSTERDLPSQLHSKSTTRSSVEKWLSEIMSSSDEPRQELTNSVGKADSQIEFSKKRNLPTQLSSESTSKSCVENWHSEAPKSSNEPRKELTNSVRKGCTEIEFSKKQKLSTQLPPESTSRSCIEKNWHSKAPKSSNEPRQELTNSGREACTQIEFSKKQNLPTWLLPGSTDRSCIQNCLSEAPKSSNGPSSSQTKEQDSSNVSHSESIERFGNSCVEHGLSTMRSLSNAIEAENVAGSSRGNIRNENQKNENDPSTSKRMRSRGKKRKEPTSVEILGLEKLKRKYKDINILNID